MFRSNIYKALIPLILLSIIGYYSYTYFLKDIYVNHQAQTIQFDSKTGINLLQLKKLPGQKNIHSIEIDIKGTSNKPISLFLGSSPTIMEQQIQIKGGNIDFQYVNDWYADVCFLQIETADGDKADLSIEYQFIGSGN